MKTITTAFTNRASRGRPLILEAGIVLAVLVLVLAFGSSNEVARASSTTWTATLTTGNSGDQYGHEDSN